MGLAAATVDGRRAGTYERHRPETTTLYAIVRDNVETLYAAVEWTDRLQQPVIRGC